MTSTVLNDAEPALEDQVGGIEEDFVLWDAVIDGTFEEEPVEYSLRVSSSYAAKDQGYISSVIREFRVC